MARTWFAKGLRGMIAKRIQLDLLRQGFCVGPADKFADGVYGNDTTTALSRLQSVRSLPVTGAVEEATWQQLTTEPLAHAVRALPEYHGRVRRPRVRIAAGQFRRRGTDLGRHRFHVVQRRNPEAACRGRGDRAGNPGSRPWAVGLGLAREDRLASRAAGGLGRQHQLRARQVAGAARMEIGFRPTRRRADHQAAPDATRLRRLFRSRRGDRPQAAPVQRARCRTLL